jgi:DNA-directed RNA polymerase subunit M/transcription elongation factor TFIIS
MARGALPTRWRTNTCPRCSKTDGRGITRRGDMSDEPTERSYVCLQCGHRVAYGTDPALEEEERKERERR